MAFFSNTVNGLPNTPAGYSPNTLPINNQTVLTNGLATNALLSISSSTIRPGYFLSKLSLTPGDDTWGLPTLSSVQAANVWIATEGVVPDDLLIDSVQGNEDQEPPVLETGMNVNVIAMPENGTAILACVTFADNTAITMNQPLFVAADGTLTTDPDTALDNTWSIGYIPVSSTAMITEPGVYQMYVVINQRAQAAPAP